jgi:hypothetical protein
MKVEIHITEILVHERFPFEAEIAFENLKNNKSIDTDLPLAELIQTAV